LLFDEATEQVQAALAILLGKGVPKPVQGQAATRNRLGPKRVGSERGMADLPGRQYGGSGTNRRASKKQKPILPENPVRVDAGQLRASRVCSFCNSFKGSDIAGLDPLTRKLTRLFNPRRHKWDHHFRYDGPVLIGRTAIGRTTIRVLQINCEAAVTLRGSLMAEGLF
jgi:hypothetical protein